MMNLAVADAKGRVTARPADGDVDAGGRAMASVHDREHGLEVQLPFLQSMLGEFKLVPLALGAADPDETSAVLDALWGGDETLIVISSDLSHYRPYRAAIQIDGETTRAIERLDDAILD